MATLCTLPIPSLTSSTPAGSITITTPPSNPNIYILAFTSPPDNRLTTPFIQTFLLALDIIEFQYPPGVVITTSSIPKFYSNGLDLVHARDTAGFFPNTLFALFKRLLTYPMPTIALLNGHAFAGGIMLAMYHDYRFCNPSRGFLCLNELDLGVPLKPAMSSIFRQKLPAPTYRTMVLEAKRFAGKEAFEVGIVDGLGGLEELVVFCEERKLAEKAKTGVYATLRMEMYRETLGYVSAEGYEKEEERAEALEKEELKRKEVGKQSVEEWTKSEGAKAKL